MKKNKIILMLDDDIHVEQAIARLQQIHQGAEIILVSNTKEDIEKIQADISSQSSVQTIQSAFIILSMQNLLKDLDDLDELFFEKPAQPDKNKPNLTLSGKSKKYYKNNIQKIVRKKFPIKKPH